MPKPQPLPRHLAEAPPIEEVEPWKEGAAHRHHYPVPLPLPEGVHPHLYTAERVRRILEAIANGCPLQVAAASAGITRETLTRWRHDIPAFSEAVELARAQAAEVLLKRVKTASLEDWKAARWLLSIMFPAEFSERRQLTVSGGLSLTAGGPDLSKLTDAELETYEQLLSKANERASDGPDPA